MSVSLDDLSDDLWLAISCHIAQTMDIINLVNLSKANKRLHRLATDNKSWFLAYRRTWPKLAIFAPYRAETSPPPNWKRRYIASYVAHHKWAHYGKQKALGNPPQYRIDLIESDPSPAGPSDTATTANTSLTEDHSINSHDIFAHNAVSSTPPPANGLTANGTELERNVYTPEAVSDGETFELELGHAVWEFIVSKKDCENMLFSVSDIADSTFARENKAAADVSGWSTVLSDLYPDRAFELSDGPLNVVGIRCLVTAHTPLDPRDPDLDEDTALQAVLFIDIEKRTLIPQSVWHCVYPYQVHLKYVDVGNNVFAVVRPAHGAWGTIHFLRVRDNDVYKEPFATMEASGGFVGERIVLWNDWGSGEGGRYFMILGWNTNHDGKGYVFDTREELVVQEVDFGINVCTIGEGDPYFPGAVLTGHFWDNEVRVWNGHTGELLAKLDGHEHMPWGFAFMDEADDRTSEGTWVRPLSLNLVSVGESLSDIEFIQWDLSHPIPPLPATALLLKDDLEYTPAPKIPHHILSLADISTERGHICTWYVHHPLLYSVTISGTFRVHNMETGELLFETGEVGYEKGVTEEVGRRFWQIQRGKRGEIVVLMSEGIVKLWNPVVEGGGREIVERAIEGKVF